MVHPQQRVSTSFKHKNKKYPMLSFYVVNGTRIKMKSVWEHQPRTARRIRWITLFVIFCLWSSFAVFVLLTFCQWLWPLNRTGVFNSHECSCTFACSGLGTTAREHRIGTLMNWWRHCLHRWFTALDSISETHKYTNLFTAILMINCNIFSIFFYKIWLIFCWIHSFGTLISAECQAGEAFSL